MSNFHQEALEVANRISRVVFKIAEFGRFNPRFAMDYEGLANDYNSLISEITNLDYSMPKVLDLAYNLDQESETEKIKAFRKEITISEKRLNNFKRKFKALLNKVGINFQFDN